MEQFYNNAMNPYGAMPGYGQPMPGYYNSVPYMYQPGPAPQNMNALNDDEIKILRSARPASKISLNIDQNEYLQALCTHKDNRTHSDVVVQLNDGSNDVWCGICQERWNPDKMTKEEVEELVKRFIDQIQNMKWVGDMPIEVVREYCAIIPLVKKFPDLYEYAVNNFNKYSGANQYYSANEAAIYNQYNALMGSGFASFMPQTMYPGAGMPGYGQPMGYMNPPMGQPANPAVNPMQAPMGMGQPQAQPSPYYGAPVMPGTGYPAMPQMGYGMPTMPGYGQPQPQMGQPMPQTPQPYSPVFNPAAAQTPAANPTAQAAAPAAETKTEQTTVAL